jgi:hypothetical protein
MTEYGYILLPPIFDESDEEAKRCLCVIMEKLKCEEMAEFSAETTAAAATGVAVGFLLAGDHSFEETAQWLEQQAKKVRRNSEPRTSGRL